MADSETEGTSLLEDLLDTEKAARRLGISPRTLQGWVRQRRLPFVKIGTLTRFRPYDIDQWITAHIVPSREASATGEDA